MPEIENISQELFDRIEQYHAGRMTVNEKTAFEDEVRRNPELAEEVSRQSELIQSVQIGAMRAQLNAIHNSEAGGKLITMRRIIAAAACVLAIIGGVWIYNLSRPSDDIFAQYSSADPGLPVPMSSNSQYAFYDAMVDYKNEKYSIAITKLTPLLATDQDNDTLLYYIASSHFNQSKWPEAKTYYNQVMLRKTSVFYDKAEWYSALIAYQQHDRARLEQIKQSTSSGYKEKIGALYDAMPE